MLATTDNSISTLATYLAVRGAMNILNALPSLFIEQLLVAVTGANGCNYCALAHNIFGKHQKLDEAELGQNLRAKLGDAKTQTALYFRGAVALNP